MKKSQTRTVREVSIVERWAAEAFFVTVTPKALKLAILKQIAMLRPRIKGLAAKSLKERVVSSRRP